MTYYFLRLKDIADVILSVLNRITAIKTVIFIAIVLIFVFFNFNIMTVNALILFAISVLIYVFPLVNPIEFKTVLDFSVVTVCDVAFDNLIVVSDILVVVEINMVGAAGFGGIAPLVRKVDSSLCCAFI